MSAKSTLFFCSLYHLKCAEYSKGNGPVALTPRFLTASYELARSDKDGYILPGARREVASLADRWFKGKLPSFEAILHGITS